VPRRPTPDPLAIALGLIGDADHADDPERRRCLLATAREVLNEAQAALLDAERALEGYTSSVVDLMRISVDRRRETINEAVARLDALDSSSDARDHA
jgi:hypothetical protein